VVAQKTFEFKLLLFKCHAERNQRRCIAHIVNTLRCVVPDVACRLPRLIHYQRTDHASHGFVH
jgi:hypothetical protein